MGSPNPGGGKPLFVGRDAELAVLMAGLDDARAGRGRFVALVGEAGIGKTRTLEEFVARAGLPDERIWWGSCPEQPGLPAYWPWTQAIGSAYLAMLLQHPGHDIHVLDLAVEHPANGSSGRDLGSDSGEVIDRRADYQRRLAELHEELGEARRFNDLGRVDRLQEEIDTIAQELSHAIALGGRHRKAGAAAERARVNVSRRITAVLGKIAEQHPALGEHLAARVHTGILCSYTPDPLHTVQWEL
jgi:predicted ATPase